MERKLSSSLSRSVIASIGPLLIAGIGLGLWLVASQLARQARVQHPSVAALASLAPTAETPPCDTFSDDGATIAARLERIPSVNGAERLEAETRFRLPTSQCWLIVSEEAEIEASGRLIRAEIGLRHLGAESGSARNREEIVHETFDAEHGRVSVTRLDGRHDVRSVAHDLPWIYVPISLPAGTQISTPSAAIVARRAAQLGGLVLRLAAAPPDLSVTSDQFAVLGAAEHWVILGDDLATFGTGDHADLLKLHIAALGLDLQPRSIGERPSAGVFSWRHE